MPDTDPSSVNVADDLGIPGSASSPHPIAGIPLPAHGFEALDSLDSLPPRELAEIPAVEVITRAGVLLMSASAEKLGLTPDGEPHPDLSEARRLITALAGLVAATQEYLGEQGLPLRDGLKTLQRAFREASSFPDEPGHGPGEKLIS